MLYFDTFLCYLSLQEGSDDLLYVHVQALDI